MVKRSDVDDSSPPQSFDEFFTFEKVTNENGMSFMYFAYDSH